MLLLKPLSQSMWCWCLWEKKKTQRHGREKEREVGGKEREVGGKEREREGGKEEET